MHGQAEAAVVGAGLAKLGVKASQIVQEFGWDDDTDDALREAIEELSGHPLEDDTYADGADVVLVWFRDGDGDLVDTLDEALTNLVDRGTLVLATPRSDQHGHVEPSESNDQNVEIVTQQLAMFESEYEAIVTAQKSQAQDKGVSA